MNNHRLEPRTRPSQTRASKTVELILTTASELLELHGFEELTTNKICKAAGLTPPALYRYFPNKYAIVSELAQRLMQQQNSALDAGGPAVIANSFNAEIVADILRDQVRITRDFNGGVAVLKTLYATPQLSEIRLSSHTDAANAMTALLTQSGTSLSADALFLRVRLIIEIGNSVIEMIVENPELDEETLIRDTADIMVFHLNK